MKKLTFALALAFTVLEIEDLQDRMREHDPDPAPAWMREHADRLWAEAVALARQIAPGGGES